MSTVSNRPNMQGRPRVRRVEPPEDAADTGEGAADWVGRFEVNVPGADARTAEQWARAVFEEQPASVRRLILFGWRRVLGLRMGSGDADSYVLGWRLVSSTPTMAVLQQDSPWLSARNIAEVGTAQFSWTTTVRYRRPLGRLPWAIVKPTHLYVVAPWLIARAARSHDPAKGTGSHGGL